MSLLNHSRTANFFNVNPVARRAGIGVAIGGVYGALGGETQEGKELNAAQRARRVLGYGALGGVAGAATGGFNKVLKDYTDEAQDIDGIKNRAAQRQKADKTPGAEDFYSDPRVAAKQVEQKMRSGGYKVDLDDAIGKGDYSRAEKLYQEAQSNLNDMTNSGLYDKRELKKIQLDLAKKYHPDTYASKRNPNVGRSVASSTSANAPIRGYLPGAGFSFMCGTINFARPFDPDLGKEYLNDVMNRTMVREIDNGALHKNQTIRGAGVGAGIGLLAGTVGGGYSAYRYNQKEDNIAKNEIAKLKGRERQLAQKTYDDGALGRNIRQGSTVVAGGLLGGLGGAVYGGQLGAYIAHEKRGGRKAAQQDIDYLSDKADVIANEDRNAYQREQHYKAYGRYPED